MRPFQKHMDDIISGEFSKTWWLTGITMTLIY
jgi:ketol-acid reductoisomerase